MRGVPLRLELGPKDIEKDQCVLARRDTREKVPVPLASLEATAAALLETIQEELLAKARAFVEANTTRVSGYAEFKEAMAEKRGFIVAGWNGDRVLEARIKEETKATIRVMPMEPREAACMVTGQPGHEVYFAQAY
jgi:prolyl-tRNA synthetase